MPDPDDNQAKHQQQSPTEPTKGEQNQPYTNNNRQKKTEMLSRDTREPMPERPPLVGTNTITTDWKIRLRIADQTRRIALQDRILIGRVIEATDIDEIDLDLTEFGAYQFGVSRRHALISLVNGTLYIEDLKSTNGTRINGFQLAPRQKYQLRDGDEIEFARLPANIRFERPLGQ